VPEFVQPPLTPRSVVCAKSSTSLASVTALHSDGPWPPASPSRKHRPIEAEIERNVQRSAAMTDQVLEAQRRVPKLVVHHKDAWAKDLSRHLSDSGALYRAAIVALEQARGASPSWSKWAAGSSFRG
jgi:hypothetical protein